MSPAMVNSEYIYNKEYQYALALQKERGMKLVNIVVEDTPGWQDLELGKFQALPQDGKPLNELSESDTKQAWKYIYNQIKTTAQRLQEQRP